MSSTTYTNLIQQLDAFIRKYYKNQIIKGGVLALALLLAMYVAMSVLAHYGQFTSTVRMGLFFGSLVTSLALLAHYLVKPFLQLNKIGTVINHTQAADIIGKHFAEVSDKLLNILQLNSTNDSELAKAAIDQKIQQLSPVKFGNAIDLSANKKYLKYLAIPLIIIGLILAISPIILSDGSERIINYNTEFVTPAPFEFKVLNKNLDTENEQDFELNVSTTGTELPQQAFVVMDGVEYIMNKISTNNYSYTFKNVLKPIEFAMQADGFTSKSYKLNVLNSPSINAFKVLLQYPNYIGKAAETINNTGDITVPAGTRLQWIFDTENTDNLFVVKNVGNDSIVKSTKDDNNFTLSTTATASCQYKIITTNAQTKLQSKVAYQLNVVPDEYPSINLQTQQDSTTRNFIALNGSIKDDYGFTKLQIVYSVKTNVLNELAAQGIDATSDATSTTKQYSIQLPVTRNSTQQDYTHVLDMNALKLKAGDELMYYVEVFDNDGAHGAKSARSNSSSYKIPSNADLNKAVDEQNTEIKKDLEKTITKAQKLQKDLAQARKKMLEKKNLSFEEKKQISDLLQEQNALQQEVEQIKKQNEENIQKQNEFAQPNERVLQKQEEINKLFNELMSEDFKKMYSEMQKMLQNVDKDKLQEKVEEMKQDSKELEKELDRTLESFKQLEFEQKLEKTKQQLEKLAEEQKQLAEKTEKAKNASEEEQQKLKAQQEELNKQFEELKKELDKLKEMGKDIPNAPDLKDAEKAGDEAKKDMKESAESLAKKDNKKASKSQKDAADKMQEMAQKMEDAMAKAEQEQAEEDAQTLRQILENLLHLSFEQESVLKDFKTMESANPQYVQLTKKQKQLQEDSKIIEDSLFALSKRQPKVSSIVNKEIADIKSNMEKAVVNLADRNTGAATMRQQFAMTAINNLSLLLSESLQQMQQQAQSESKSKKSGNGSCNKPGGSGSPKAGKGKGKPKPSMASMRQMQQSLSKQLEQMKNGQKPGGSSGQGQGQGMSKELAKMAAQQEYLRQQMQGAASQGSGSGKGDGQGKEGKEGKDGKDGGKESGGDKGNAQQLREIAKQMEQTESDIVNKRITQETLNRQKEILSRLLEAEKAEREREQDDKRKSNEAKEIKSGAPASFAKYEQLKKRETELLQTIPPNLNFYYKSKVSDYFSNVNKK
jgi:hypothetical protein